MNISFERPYAFYALLIMIPVLLFLVNKYNNFIKAFNKKNRIQKANLHFTRAKRCFILRTILRSFSWICLVLAMSGISWGNKAVPVQKNGRAVTFVFDISHSMEANDGPDNKSRLQSVVSYTQELLEYMDGVTVAAVIAKGSGVIAIPQTEDREVIDTLLNSLSPKLMSSEGTSLGSGINAAITSFPSQSLQANYIWVFTDGEETDSSLASSLMQALSFGIPVSIVGFGSERESEILSGDGKTTVKTALRSDAVKKTINDVNKKTNVHGTVKNPCTIQYIDASEVGSAYSLLKQLSVTSSDSKDSESIAYEIQTVSRHKLFIVISIILLIASFIASEFTLEYHKKLFTALTGALVITLTLTGCSSKFNDRMTLLQGRIDWNARNYQQAVAEFLQVAENAKERGDEETLNYALFGLATTYLKQNEEEASITRFRQISPDVGDRLKFDILYNEGIIANTEGNYLEAAELFMQALLIDSTNINAKINLELSLMHENVQSDVKEQELTPISQNDDEQSLKTAVYSIIRENEQNQWKNQQQNTESSSMDY